MDLPNHAVSTLLLIERQYTISMGKFSCWRLSLHSLPEDQRT